MSNILKHVELVKRETFDPTNPVHLESMREFIRTGNWGTVQFYHELPYIEVPMTVLMKYAMHTLGVVRETSVEREERLNTKNLVTAPRPMTGAQSRAANIENLVSANQLMDAQLASVRGDQ